MPLARVFAVVLILLLIPSFLFGQKNKDKKPLPKGTPVLWREPADIASGNLFVGPGGETMKPDLTTPAADKSSLTAIIRLMGAELGTEVEDAAAPARLRSDQT